MNPLDKLIKAIMDALAGTTAAINKSIETLPPVEQFEANQELAFPLRMMKSCGADLIERCNFLSGRLPDLTAELEAAAVAEARKALEASPDFIAKSVHDAAVTSAAETARTETRNAIEADRQRDANATAERKKLVEGGLTAIAAEALSIDVLLGDETAKTTAVSAMKDRLAKLKKLNLTEANAAGFMAEICGLPLDAAGEAQVTKSLGAIEAAASASRQTAPPPNPLAGGGGDGNKKTFTHDELV